MNNTALHYNEKYALHVSVFWEAERSTLMAFLPSGYQWLGKWFADILHGKYNHSKGLFSRKQKGLP
jgi:hypothetical protein